ncbi:hypothetical protein ACQP1V_42885 (plasmid) [Microtetraspora malaysiensis]|uniref:hypothetical protein n=1 Tax=Microtetraspora malaysiensis TaxID=161358 RepID=UPI003D8A4A8C
MAWYYIVSAVCLGFGLVFGGFRRRKKGDGESKGKPRGKLGVVAAILLLIASFCGFLSPAGGWAASFGNWLAVSFWLAAFVLIAASAFLGAGTWLDLKDGVPDRPTLIACMVGPFLIGAALGAIYGADIHSQIVQQVELGRTGLVTGVQAGGR